MSLSMNYESLPTSSNPIIELTTVSPNIAEQFDSIQSVSDSSPISNNNYSHSPLSLPPRSSLTDSHQVNSSSTISPSRSTGSSHHTLSTNNRAGIRISVQTEGPYSLPNFGAYKYNRMFEIEISFICRI